MTTALIGQPDNIDTYMREVKRYSQLSRDEEQELAHRYHDTGDLQAAHRLVVAKKFTDCQGAAA